MSLTAKDIVASVRASLDYPSPDSLKEPTLLLKIQEKTDYYLTRMELTDRNWFLDSFILPVVPDEATYNVTASAASWGRPMLIDTQDLSDPNHIRREVEIIDLADRDLTYFGSAKNVGDSQTHSARSATFYRKMSDGETYVLLTPTPSESAEYIIWYEPNRQLPVSLNDNLRFLDNFKNLLVTDVSLACLPLARLPQPLASDLEKSLLRDFSTYFGTFEEYIQNDKQQQVQRKKAWGRDRRSEDWLV